ncbi:MAG: nitroreductase family protein [Desulfopila sp.]|jgi:nitroreductase/NAD-dependent dihydropyrimidine dehydrogenase PreA subunit|nr:nitroreductase family protein [Desulfopila sp.]
MTFFTIDEQKCHKDGLCAAVCPVGIIDMIEDSDFPKPAPNAEERCISCGHCMAICPHGALRLDAFQVPSLPSFDNTLLPDVEQMTQLIRGRRSTRVYRSKAVDRKTIEQLIQLARYAPTARNSQLLQWLVIDTPEELKVLKQHTLDWMGDLLNKEDPVAVSYSFADIIQAWQEGQDPILRDAPGLVLLHAPSQYPSALVDSTIAATTFELAAAAMKLGTCWAGYFMSAARAWQPLRHHLNLPPGQALTSALMLGYPKYVYTGLPLRKKPSITWR